MYARCAVVLGILIAAFLAAPLAGQAQPTLEQIRFDPPQLCLRDTFRWSFSYRDFPGGLAAVKQLEVSGRWEGPGEPSVRSSVTPTGEELQRYTADQGRFESQVWHWSPLGRKPGEIHYTLRAVLADGREVASTVSVRYVEGCPSPPRQTTLAAGPSGASGLRPPRRAPPSSSRA